MVFHAYMLLCSDGSYYTGHTDNLEQRVRQHQKGAIAGWTKSRRPLRLVWSQEFTERYEALSAERQIKGWSRAKKEALIDKRWDELSLLSRGKSQFALRQAQDERVVHDLVVAEAAFDRILAVTRASAPNEVCGILLGFGNRIDRVVETRNIHPTPKTHFEIDPQALIDAHRAEREGGAQIIGYFHSHPVGEARPSATDQAMAAGDGKVWAIIAGEDLTFWRDESDGFRPLSYAIEER